MKLRGFVFFAHERISNGGRFCIGKIMYRIVAIREECDFSARLGVLLDPLIVIRKATICHFCIY